MRKSLAIIVGVVAAAAVGYAVGRTARSEGSSGDGAVIARFSGRALRASDVEARLRAMPDIARARFTSPDARKAFVEDLAHEQILARLAEEKGYQRDPDFAKRYAEELGSFYLEKEFEEPERRRAPTDDELRAYFDGHRAELSRPERVRIALVAFKAASPLERQQKRALAAAALREARARAKDYYAFGNLARMRSEDPRTRAAGGEVGYASREELEQQYGPELAQAAFELKSANEVRSALVERPDAFYVVKLLGREAAYEPRFEAVRDTLRARLASERRNADRKRFLEELWKKAELWIDDEAVRNLEVASAKRP